MVLATHRHLHAEWGKRTSSPLISLSGKKLSLIGLYLNLSFHCSSVSVTLLWTILSEDHCFKGGITSHSPQRVLMGKWEHQTEKSQTTDLRKQGLHIGRTVCSVSSIPTFTQWLSAFTWTHVSRDLPQMSPGLSETTAYSYLPKCKPARTMSEG